MSPQGGEDTKGSDSKTGEIRHQGFKLLNIQKRSYDQAHVSDISIFPIVAQRDCKPVTSPLISGNTKHLMLCNLTHYISFELHYSVVVIAGSKGKGKQTAEEELRASKGKGKMTEPADIDDDEEDEEDFDEDVSWQCCFNCPMPLAVCDCH